MKLQGKALKGKLPNNNKYRIGIITTPFSVKLKLQERKFCTWFTSKIVVRYYNITNDTFQEAYISAFAELEPIVNQKLIIQ